MDAVLIRWSEFLGAIRFLTRFPLPVLGEEGPDLGQADLGRTVWAFPLVGAGLGALSGGVFAFALFWHLPPLGAALLALTTIMLATGALHEDGLADTVDGFGGGRDRERKLAIMRDSRIGSYGVLALILGVGLRAAALAALGGFPGDAVLALIAAQAASRAFIPLAMQFLEPARADGLGAAMGRPGAPEAAIAAGLGAWIGLLALGPAGGAAALIGAGGCVLVLLLLARRQIGGYTGDVLGSVQQIGEIAMLLAAAAAA